jgi:hypothetical protein
MARYVLFCRKPNPVPEDLALIAKTPGLRMIDNTEGRALLVEASANSIERLRSELKSWVVADEATYPRPGRPREQVKVPGPEKKGA